VSIFKRSAPDAGERWILVGLGNPGDRYEGTRHNAGAMVVDVLAQRVGSRLKSHRSGCLVAEGQLSGDRVVVARPTSFMNESGRPVRKLMDFYKAPLDKLVVIHDEIDIPFGEIRLKAGGGTAGHNGLKSIVSHVGSNDFLRVRFGVSRPRGRDATVGHVLDRFSGSERKELPDLLETAADAAERIVEVGAERAMNEYNTRA
jgi:PTH1 family peptidyl-tRNA hydrolase